MPLPESNLFFGIGPKMTNEQRRYVDAIFDKKVVVTPSVAGTGKTTLAVGAAKILQCDLVWVFPNLGEDEFGHMPGTLWEKQRQYLGPLFDSLEEIGEDPSKCIWNDDALKDPKQAAEQIKRMKEGKIWVFPKAHGFLRGCNLKGNKVVVIDEAQNFTLPQLKKIITRVHDSVEALILTGHMGQCDLPNLRHSGFPAYIDFYRTVDYAAVIELTECFRGQIAADADKVSDYCISN